jgi:hypothetical protein
MDINKNKYIAILIFFLQIIYLNENIFALELNDYGITKEIKIYGKIILKDNYGPPNYGENPETDKIETYYYILLQKPLRIKINNVDNKITEMQIILNENIIKRYSTENVYKIYGNLFLATTGHHHTEVLINTNKIEDISEKWDNIYNWLIKESGSYKGQPIPNWIFIIVLIIFGINIIWIMIKWIKRKICA